MIEGIRASRPEAHVGLLVRLAQPSDIEGVLALQSYWLNVGHTTTEIADGFLVGQPYTTAELSSCMRERGVGVADIGGRIVGYLLFDNWSDNPQTREFGETGRRLARAGVIPESRICARAQVAIARDCQGLGIYRKLLALMFETLQDRFDAAFAAVIKTNPKMTTHQIVGFQTVDQDDRYFYGLLPLNTPRERR